MPVPEDICKVQLVWESEPNAEIVTWSFHMQRHYGALEHPATDWPAELADLTQRVGTKLAGSSGAGVRGTLWGMQKLLEVNGYHLDPVTGRADAQGRYVPPSPVVGTGSVNPLPFDVAAVVSLRTQESGETLADPDVGPSPLKRSRGRIFVGVLPSTAVGTNGRFTAAYCTALADGWKLWLDDLHKTGTIGGPVEIDYWNLGVLSKAGGTFRTIRDLVIDDLPDTQRRRSNRQVPVRQVRAMSQS